VNHILAAVLLGLLAGVSACGGLRASGSSSGTSAAAPRTAGRGGNASPWLDDPVAYTGTADSAPVAAESTDDDSSKDDGDDFGGGGGDDGGDTSGDDLGEGVEEIEIDLGDDGGWGDDEDWPEDDEESAAAE
jgi:hypothetical protein